MNKVDYIDRLINYGENRAELNRLDIEDLKEKLAEYEDESNLFPNGRDSDAEDEDRI